MVITFDLDYEIVPCACIFYHKFIEKLVIVEILKYGVNEIYDFWCIISNSWCLMPLLVQNLIIIPYLIYINLIVLPKYSDGKLGDGNLSQ